MLNIRLKENTGKHVAFFNPMEDAGMNIGQIWDGVDAHSL